MLCLGQNGRQLQFFTLPCMCACLTVILSLFCFGLCILSRKQMGGALDYPGHQCGPRAEKWMEQKKGVHDRTGEGGRKDCRPRHTRASRNWRRCKTASPRGPQGACPSTVGIQRSQPDWLEGFAVLAVVEHERCISSSHVFSSICGDWLQGHAVVLTPFRGTWCSSLLRGLTESGRAALLGVMAHMDFYASS